MGRSEVLLWVRLRGREPGQPTVRRQHPIGPYITDFCCSAARLAIEVDGGVHQHEDKMADDAHREAFLVARGYRVTRVTDRDVLADPDGVAARVRDAARDSPPSRSA
jgi:very-short-patch-repair endonuclease